MNGYLAFADESEDAPVIGWMSANKHNNYRLLPPVEDELTATVICISVQKEHQGKGIASALLEFAIKDLKSQGFKKVQAAPLANGEFHDWGYRGPLSLYQKHGFSVGPQIDTQHVLVIRNLDS